MTVEWLRLWVACKFLPKGWIAVRDYELSLLLEAAQTVANDVIIGAIHPDERRHNHKLGLLYNALVRWRTWGQHIERPTEEED